MNYQYTAKALNGTTSSGFLDAGSALEARRQLQEKGLFTLSLRPAAAAAMQASQAPRRMGSKRVSPSDLLMLTCQLRVMVLSGIDIAEALNNVAESSQHPVLSKVLKDAYEDVASGKTMSIALGRQSHVFGEAYVASIAAAEASGTMPMALGRLAELQRNAIRLRGSLVSALAYPAVLAGVAVLVVTALIVFVLPQFGTIFSDLGSTPPMMTQVLLDTSAGVRKFGIWGAAAGVLAAALVWHYWLRGRAAQLRDHLILNGALSQRAARPLMLGATFRLLATVLQSGVPLLEALQLVRRSTRNSLYQKLFSQLAAEVERGNGIADTLRHTEFIPSGAAQMVRTAEESGDLAGILETVGFFYEEEGERQLKNLVKMIEPAIIVFMGVVVAVVVASVMLPLLDVSTVVS
ncbi:Putative type II secretion system protein F [Maioricimonas rarisocia]|uniref:Type II secretion system protein F n=1 Tax=Maioricimonas rarisocia TaxID=2528026 RepID=A0A517ZCC4_9PLAN|nr:type II secretion system F family protein [Maioricimonas rarisocia]QDU40138.1 Putative type II secretion system protein F [Maioricimonas rarisocia]